MDDHRVLIVNRSPGFLPGLSRRLGVDRPHLIADTVRDLSGALDRLKDCGYDAVLLALDKPDGLSLVLRIRDAAGRIPLLALAPRPIPALDFLVREGFADEVIPTGGDDRLAARRVGRALETWRLLARGRAALLRAAQLREEMSDLADRRERIHARAFRLHRIPFSEFLPLIVEPDPADAAALRGAFEVAGLPLSLPLVRDGEEALRHLERRLFPPPTLALLADPDAARRLPEIRSRAPSIPAFSLGSPIPGCDAAFQKPATVAGWIHTARRIVVRWARLRRR